MRVGETEVAAKRADTPDPNVRHAALHLGERWNEAVDEGRGFQLAVRHSGPDAEPAVALLEHAELRNSLQVDEIRIGGKAELHHEEKLGTAAVDDSVVPVLREEVFDLVERARSMQGERRQGHATGAAAPARTSSAASTPSPICACAPRSVSERPRAATPTTG